ncbi:MAG: HAMP domain-containing histidine kinase [Alphaproteobacteria bacterium]|nr:HAMP domain-containing histidine kinase [Alphaproteobacteria bacterium]MBV9418407.1 HAMP domain-containing histidine kinase [Alphaproteobacteria bacterium]MBV9542543.1 HAMP domain-containing histidine kinase [Alphaproteobacteria bacterium]MBV9904693.1 HAMP domain-containing histidine kinase [Alphaproteobacteria bacterium]
MRLRLPGFLRTQAYRIVLVYVTLFLFSVTALLYFTYWNTKRSLDSQTDQTIEAEITGLSEQYSQLGLRGLADVVMNRSARGGSGLYLLANSLKQPVVGNLTGWPENMDRPGNYVEFDYQRRIENQVETRRARGRVFKLPGDYYLLVARDVHERFLIQRLFTTTLPWTVGLVLILGLVGGAVMSRNMLARLESINRTSGEIMAGDLSRRVPLAGSQDEFDSLAGNLNAMLDRIERLMKGVREVTDSVAHDLRTPLNRLRNRLEATLRHLDPGSNQAGEIEAAVAETDQLIATFNALLLIAEADAGVVRGAIAPIDLSSIAQDMTELYAPLAEEKNVTLKIPPMGTTMIDGNRSLVSQALANLVDNAIKYTPSGGDVTVTAQETPQGVELRVADSGPGIPEAQRTHAVERFVRLDASRNSPGTGLGLSMVAAVARLHDARFLLEDNYPGLKAIIRFPRPTVRAR